MSAAAPVLAGVRVCDPHPEPAARRRRTLALGLLASLAGLAYVVYRIAYTLPPRPHPLAWAILVFEALPVLGVMRRTEASWCIDPPRPIPPPVTRTAHRVALVIPTYDEPAEVLLPTIAAAAALRPAHETWVLDDGRRPEIAALARQLGARYLARSHNHHAKAGNLNHALGLDPTACGAGCASGHVEADLVAVVDCDHVPFPGFLTNLIGYFDADPSIALVQASPAFYNDGSFEHHNTARYSEQELFFQVAQRAKDRLGAAFWCGTTAMLRTRALAEIGGVATETVCEDLHTSLRLRRHGWRIAYHAEVLSAGLAAQSADQYLTQRRRWALGSFQVAKAERIWRAPYLTLRQRLEFSATALWWFDGAAVLACAFTAALVALVSPQVVGAPFTHWFFPLAAVQWARLVALRQLGRGRSSPVQSAILQIVRAAASVSALAAFALRRPAGFEVTPKGRRSGRRARARIPGLIWTVIAAAYAGFVCVLAHILELFPWGQHDPGALLVSGFGILLLSSAATAAAAMIRSEQAGADRRAAYRVGVELPARLELRGERGVGDEGEAVIEAATIDLTPQGAGLWTAARRPARSGEAVRLTLLPPYCAPISLVGTTTRVIRRPDPNRIGRLRTYVGVDFEGEQVATKAAIALLLFHGVGMAPPAGGATAVAPPRVTPAPARRRRAAPPALRRVRD